MNKTTLTKEQLKALAPYERYFKQATLSRSCSYPGAAAVEKMRAIWQDLTGTTQKFNTGCSVCIFNLVFDLGTLYFAQVAAQKAQNTAKTPAKDAKVPNSQSKIARKFKGNGQKCKVT